MPRPGPEGRVMTTIIPGMVVTHLVLTDAPRNPGKARNKGSERTGQAARPVILAGIQEVETAVDLKRGFQTSFFRRCPGLISIIQEHIPDGVCIDTKPPPLIRDLQDLQVEIVSTKSEETVDSLPGETGGGGDSS